MPWPRWEDKPSNWLAAKEHGTWNSVDGPAAAALLKAASRLQVTVLEPDLVLAPNGGVRIHLLQVPLNYLEEEKSENGIRLGSPEK
eukprot:1061591-Amphidinium_carterae.2